MPSVFSAVFNENFAIRDGDKVGAIFDASRIGARIAGKRGNKSSVQQFKRRNEWSLFIVRFHLRVVLYGLWLTDKGSVKVAAEAQGDHGEENGKREPNGPRCYYLNESVVCHNAGNSVAPPLPLQAQPIDQANLVVQLIAVLACPNSPFAIPPHRLPFSPSCSLFK